jgi:SAM-dependent methyltransferase
VTVRGAYDAAAARWSDGPALVYAALARAMVERVAVHGTVLDVGAGNGVTARAALDAGARRAVLCDVSAGMLRSASLPGVVADAAHLPFGDRRFDLALAGCLLGHVDDPSATVRDMARVATTVVASAFGADWTHPAKAVVDDLLVGAGYVAPSWYVRLKDEGEPAVADRTRLAAVAAHAGLGDVVVDELVVDTGLRDTVGLVAWRLGLAQYATFLTALAPGRLAALRADAEAALADAPVLRMPLLVLVGSAADHRR